MKLIELAKKNLQEYISVKETLELISTTQQTPLSYVATFLISQSFETNIPTYDADKYYSIHSNDDWNWGVFQYTNSILSNLADNEVYKDAFTFSGNDLPENLENTYWKRKELYNLELIKNLSLDFYFRVQDIKIIAQHTSFDSKEFESKELFSDIDVKKLLKNGISSYMPGSAKKYNLIDDFVLSSLGFFECNFDKGFEIKRDDLKKLFFENQIIIKGFNDFSPKSSQSNSNIWDAQYLNILKDDVPDLKIDDYELFEDSITNYLNESGLIKDPKENTLKQIENQIPLHIKILAMNDYFTVIESACFISFDEPEKIQAYVDSGDFTYDAWRYGEHIQAVKVIENGIRANNLDIEDDGMIPRVSLQRFLYERNHVISGFNDNQSLLILPRYGDPSIGYASPESYQKERAQLLKELKQLESELEQEKLQSSLLILDNQSSLSETNQLKARITELEAAQPKPIDSDVQLSPEQEIPNSRQRNNILRIISILSQMADLPPEPFSAFNVLEAYADQNNKEIPSKHTVADWLKKARDSN
ncbi:MAG TPA: hypothetical protein PLW46_08720 [Acinetobacter johnsonii]|mgnify:CR=1 FL=1|uniref:hypothetical protein n=1 Tax=Acinetobacter johnsonii TaxID=40214 RepID=UPI002C61716D|nr:hypothetical protein [Acinetobacter johnsonii]